MRAHVPLLAVSLIFACTDDKDPLDGVTAGATTTTAASDSSPSSGGETSGPDTAATTDNSTSPTSATSATSATTTTATSSTTDATTGPGTSATTDPSVSATATASTTGDTTGDPGDPFDAARQLCVDTINMYRATLGLPAYERWKDAESCSDAEAMSDGQTNTPHGAFGMCGEWAQNECPGWPGPPEQSLPDCLAQMWAEGPGQDFNTHGHYINMSSEMYTRVACGFAEGNGGWWMVQNFQ